MAPGSRSDRHRISARAARSGRDCRARLADLRTARLTTFIGLVRDHNAGRRVLWIDYEAHEALAGRVFDRIGVETQERWPECGAWRFITESAKSRSARRAS